MRTRRGTYASPTDAVKSIFPQPPFSTAYPLLRQAPSVDEQNHTAQQTQVQASKASHGTSSRRSIRGIGRRAMGTRRREVQQRKQHRRDIRHQVSILSLVVPTPDGLLTKDSRITLLHWTVAIVDRKMDQLALYFYHLASWERQRLVCLECELPSLKLANILPRTPLMPGFLHIQARISQEQTIRFFGSFLQKSSRWLRISRARTPTTRLRRS